MMGRHSHAAAAAAAAAAGDDSHLPLGDVVLPLEDEAILSTLGAYLFVILDLALQHLFAALFVSPGRSMEGFRLAG